MAGDVDGELTLVFDAGENSADNVELFDDSPLHFVGSLPPSDHPDLLAVATDRYQAVDEARFPGLRGADFEQCVEMRSPIQYEAILADQADQASRETHAA